MRNYPGDWGYSNLGSICVASQYGINAPSNGGRYPVLGMKNLQDGKINPSDVGFVGLSPSELEKYKLRPGDLLINRTNSAELVGKTALFDLPGDYVFASYLVRFILDLKKVLPEYLNYYCNSHVGNYQMQRLATKGVSQANINPTELKKKFYVPLPPVSEQLKIVEILSAWDKSISLAERLTVALQSRKKGLMQRLLTGQVRFQSFGDEWREEELGDVFTERVERGFEHLPLLSVTEHGITYRDNLGRRDKSSEDKSRYLRIHPGDIGYNTMRMWQGRSALSQYEGIVSPAYTILAPRKNVDAKFMAYLFKFQPMIHTFYRYSQGLVSDTWSLKYPIFAKIRVRIPDLDEQNRISILLELCDKEIADTMAYIAMLQLQKKGLVQRLLTGELRVKVK